MFHYSPCLDIFFKDLPFPERIRKAASLGYTHFEFWTWWDKDLGAVGEAMKETGMKAACFCTRFVTMLDPLKRAEYLAGLEKSIAVARRLGSRQLITQVGNEIAGVSRDEQKRALVATLKAAVPLLEASGITLLIEPLNLQYDHKGYFLALSAEAAEIVAAAGSPSVKILFDIYHQQINEGNLINNIKKHLPSIGHFHVADHPGRHELGTGEINYQNVLGAIKEAGYGGCVGVELFPLDADHARALAKSSPAV